MEIYIHIPFCKKKCHYCDFASCAGREEAMERYCRALRKEIMLRAEQYGPVPVSTLYIGGGTPSVMPSNLLYDVLTCLYDHFPLMAGAEITCEMNPGTITKSFLTMLKSLGVNRLSLGAQALQKAHLCTLGRIHCWEDVKAAVLLLREFEFENLNLDLMFGLPGQTRGDWQDTVQAALELTPLHLSCYGLILEEGTRLNDQVSKGMLTLPPVETERKMYCDVQRILRHAGMKQYEISNFAFPGRECRHNLGYWHGAYYLGLGAAAHSRMACAAEEGVYVRYGNAPDLDEYMTGVEEGRIPLAEYNAVSAREAEFETLMLGLRVLSGVKDTNFYRRHGRTLTDAFGDKIPMLMKKGLLKYTAGSLRLTRRGMDVQNAVLVELMD